jgi:cytoskeletal protein CcmA (bactofilin family)
MRSRTFAFGGHSMEQRAQLGASIRIKGEFSAKEDVVIAGHIEGTVNVEGHLVVVESGAALQADIVARAIIVSGSLKGSLVAEERIELRNNAQVEGELSAPRVGMADGALFRGKLETEKAKVKLATAS